MIQVQAGQVIGRDHLARRVNCQDAFEHIAYGDVEIAIVCDGCGEGKSSEVGANLAAAFLVSESMRLLSAGSVLDTIPDFLYQRLVGFLERVCVSLQPQNRLEFIQNNLLFTVLGVIVTSDGGIAFSAGDGQIFIDGYLSTIDQNNTPHYPAYHLISEHLPPDFPPPAGFEVYPISSMWKRVLIATDGFEPELLDAVWGFTNPRGLQRRMNIWSDQDHRFRDDATLITLEKVTGKTE